MKDSALCLTDLYVKVKSGDQEHVNKVSVKEQLCELQGRQNQMILEVAFVRNATNRHKEILKREKKDKK